jgi:opine dehydrogenase
MNINAVIHPPGMLMNTGWIEYKNGDFLFYKEGITPAVARVIEAVDRERLAIGSKFNLLLPTFIDYFCEAGLTSEAARQSRSVYRAMQESHPNRTIKSPPSLNHRYLHEDVGYGLVPMVEFGRLANISTPTMESLITLSSIAQGVDYCREGLTLQQMNLEGLSIEELLKVVTEGNSARHKK